MGYGHREATGTSLAAIAVIGGFVAGRAGGLLGVGGGVVGNVRLRDGLMIGLLAPLGLLAGVQLVFA